MSANYRNPQWLLPNCKNLKLPGTGTSVGSGLTEDRHSLYSMDFSGSGDKIQTGLTPPLADNSRSISLWFYTSNSSSHNMCGYGAASQVSGHNGFDILTYTGNYVGIHLFGTAVIAGGTYNLNAWNHYVITYDGTTLQGYLNGVAVDSNNTEVVNTLSTNNFIIGEGVYTGFNGFSGKIDEVAIFNTALTLSEVQALSTANAPANIMALDKKPVAYYPLGEQARVGGDANPNAGGSEWQFPNEVLQSHVFDFDGSTDYIDAGSSLGVIGTEVRTFSIWLKTSQTSVTQTVLGTRNYNTDGWVIQIYPNSILFYNVLGGATGHYSDDKGIYTTAANLTDGNWHHLVIVRAGAGNNKIYVDGVSQTLNTTYGDENLKDPQSSKNLLIGAGYNTGGALYRFFDGELSNLAIWNSDQSANMANIYNNGAPQSSYTVTPTAWYKLNATNTYAGLNPNWHSALDFISSENDYIDCGNNSSFDITSALTLSAWIKLSSSTTDQFYISKRSSSGDGYQISSFSNKAAGMSIWIGGSRKDLLGTTTHVQDVWYHVVGTYDGSNMRIYLNGVEENSVAQTGAIDTTTAKLILGAYDGVGYSLDGQLSNCAIYNQAISAEDILYLYNGGTPQTNISFEPTSWYKLDNLTTGIQDSGSASNNGTNSGATAVSSSVAVNQWNFNNVSQSQTPNWSSALDFVGASNQYLNFGNNILQDLSNSGTIDSAITFSMWFKLGSSTTSRGMLSIGTFTNSYGKLDVRHQSSAIQIVLTNPTASVEYTYSFTDTSSWHNLVIVYDPTSASNSLVYIDGVQAGSNITNVVNLAITSQNLYIGAYYGNSDTFTGQISNVSAFNTALNAAAISTLYNNGQPEAAISSSPVSWWKLDNTTTGIQDSVGSNNGTNNGTTEIQTNVWTPRLNGESDTLPSTALVSSDLQFESPYSNFSLNFDGTGNKVDFGDSDVFSFGDGVTDSPLSFSVWINLATLGAPHCVINKQTSSSNGEYKIYISTAGKIYIELANNGGEANGARGIQSGTNLSIDQWYHLAFTYDGRGGSSAYDGMNLYINGSLDSSTDWSYLSYTAMNNTNADFILGDLITGGSNTYDFNGNLDEAAIFNKALTQAEVSQIYNNGYAADLTSLSPVSWWRLGEDAYFVNNFITVPNQISGAPNGTGAGTQTSILVADAPGSYASGAGTNLAVEDRKGDAPESTANSLSFNMIPTNRVSYPAGYTPTQIDNVYSMAFDGADDYFSAPISFLNSATVCSISFWGKKDASNKELVVGGRINGSDGIWIQWYTDGTIYFSPRGSGAGSFSLSYAQSYDADWHHYVGVYDGSSAANCKLYLDGNLVATGTGTPPSSLPATTGDVFQIGALGTTFYTTGSIDEVAIFDYVLSERQIKQDIYDGTTTGKTADLNNISNLKAPVAWYRMGD